MGHYEVRWVFDIQDAEDLLDAARQALAVQRDPESWATVFEVRKKGESEWTTVDPQPFSDDGQCRHLHAASGSYCLKPEGHVQRGDRKHGYAGAFDTTGVQVGDPDPWTGDYDMCDARLESAIYLICTAPRGHTGPHVAAGESDIVGVDPSVTDAARAETTTAAATIGVDPAWPDARITLETP